MTCQLHKHSPDLGLLKLATLVLVIGFCLGAADAELTGLKHGRKLLQDNTAGNTTDSAVGTTDNAPANAAVNTAGPVVNTTAAALQLCSTLSFAAQRCALADEAEETTTTECLCCGTVFRGLPNDLPAEIEGRDSYYQIGNKVLSLACKGPVVVRSVFKMLAALDTFSYGANCSAAGLEKLGGSGSAIDSAVIRCELELPAANGTASNGIATNGTATNGTSEVQRALRSKEVRCWRCGRCGSGEGCPNRLGVWYSHAYTTATPGCGFTPTDNYEPHTVGFVINSDTKVLLAKVEACNTPGCFNATYEQAKQGTAKPCMDGTCAE